MAEVVANNEISVVVNVTGEQSGTNYSGCFKMKERLSLADYVAKDRMRREMLGSVAPEYADPRARNIADVLSELNVRVKAGPKDAPSWWIESRGGLDLEDDEPARAVYVAMEAKLAERAEERKKKVEAARSEISEAVSDK